MAAAPCLAAALGLAALALMATVLAATAWASEPTVPQEALPLRETRIVKTTEPPVIDGVLDDAVWERAAKLTDFVRRIPYHGQPASGDMEVRLLRDVVDDDQDLADVVDVAAERLDGAGQRLDRRAESCHGRSHRQVGQRRGLCPAICLKVSGVLT